MQKVLALYEASTYNTYIGQRNGSLQTEGKTK
jgi:hypothetical protein